MHVLSPKILHLCAILIAKPLRGYGQFPFDDRSMLLRLKQCTMPEILAVLATDAPRFRARAMIGVDISPAPAPMPER